MIPLLRLAPTIVALLVSAAILAACSRGSDTAPMPVDDGFANDRERVSYVFGVEFGTRIAPARDEIDTAVLAQAIADVLEGREPKLSPDEVAQVRQEFTQRMQQRLQIERQQSAERNLREGEAFLAANARKPEVVVTESGLQYRVVREGSGPKPSVRDRVRVHYHGTLIDGTIFDSSVERGEPAEFALGGVILGWVEALRQMPVGSKYQLFIPPHLAYREQGTGQIGPNATLIFDVELLEIVD